MKKTRRAGEPDRRGNQRGVHAEPLVAAASTPRLQKWRPELGAQVTATGDMTPKELLEAFDVALNQGLRECVVKVPGGSGYRGGQRKRVARGVGGTSLSGNIVGHDGPDLLVLLNPMIMLRYVMKQAVMKRWAPQPSRVM
jgi:hypothetical protein